MKRRRFVPLVLGFVASLTIAACGSSGGGGDGGGTKAAGGSPLTVGGEQVADAQLYAQAKKEGKLVLYSAYLETTIKPVIAAFTKDTGIKVQYVRQPTGPLTTRIEGEAAAKTNSADVVQLSDPAAAVELKSKGLLSCIALPPALSKLKEAQFADGTGHCFYPVTFGVMVIEWNNKVVKDGDAPKTWHDLLDPKWKGKIGLTYIGVGGSAYSAWLMLAQKFTQSYWKSFAANNPKILESTATIAQQVQRGELPIGIVAPGSVVSGQESGSPISFSVPSDGVGAYPNVTAMVKNGPDPAAAEVFRNWSFSVRGQTIYAAEGDWGTRDGVPPPKNFPEADNLPLVNTSLDQYLSLQAPYTSSWNSIFHYVTK